MAGTSTPIYPQTVGTGYAQILPADTTTLKTLYTAGANGSVIENILVSSNDSAIKDIQFTISHGGLDYVVGALSIPVNAGNTAAVPLVSVFKHANFVSVLSTDANNNTILRLPSGSVLKVKVLITMTTAKTLSVIAQGGDY